MTRLNKKSNIKIISILVIFTAVFSLTLFSNTPETLGQDEGFSFLPNNTNSSNIGGFDWFGVFNPNADNDSYTLGPNQTQNQGSAVQTNSVSDTSSLEQLINQQNQKDAEALRRAQEQDRQECRAEAGMAPGGVLDGNTTAINPGTGGWGSGANPLGGSNNGIPSVGAGNEQEVRDALEEVGVSINGDKQPCNGRRYQDVPGGCTDVANLPQSAIDGLANITNQTGSNIALTGGTEAGHQTHGPGNAIVDLERGNSALNDYVAQNTVGTYQSSAGTWYQLNDGTRFLDEGTHWHVVFPENVNSPTDLIITFNKKIDSLFLNWI